MGKIEVQHVYGICVSNCVSNDKNKKRNVSKIKKVATGGLPNSFTFI